MHYNIPFESIQAISKIPMIEISFCNVLQINSYISKRLGSLLTNQQYQTKVKPDQKGWL